MSTWQIVGLILLVQVAEVGLAGLLLSVGAGTAEQQCDPCEESLG